MTEPDIADRPVLAVILRAAVHLIGQDYRGAAKLLRKAAKDLDKWPKWHYLLHLRRQASF